jgi:hypothetical protein
MNNIQGYDNRIKCSDAVKMRFMAITRILVLFK